MGAGKTTIGKMLAKELGVPVYDTDQEVEKMTGKSISDIFDQEGEAFFRSLETKVLKKLPTKECVITTGGGIILKEENCLWLAEHGNWIYLHCDPDEIAKRLVRDTTRPLLNGEKKKNLHTLFNARLPLYQKAEITINTTGKSILTIIDEIKTRIH